MLNSVQFILRFKKRKRWIDLIELKLKTEGKTVKSLFKKLR
jgi:hypothetical protein